MSNYFNVGTALYGTFQDFIIGGSDVVNEINYCTKLDNIWIKVGNAVDTDIYDYNNDEYDYDFNINNDIQKYGIQSTLNNVFNVDNNIETWNNTYNLKYTNTITSSNIDSTTFAIEDVNDVRKIDEFTVYIEGKRNNKNEAIDILGKNNVFERLIKSPNVISKVKAFNNNKIKFINNDELIVQDKNINVVLGYLTGELEQTECKTNGYYIKVFNHNTNRFIGEYEIINGVFTIDNLNYYEYYDVVLCDRLNKIENQVMSKRRPTLYNIYDNINYYKPNINFGEMFNTEILVVPLSRFNIRNKNGGYVSPTYMNDTEYYIFTDSSELYSINITTNDDPIYIDVLLVGGGGAGGHINSGGGGGAGGYIRRTIKIEPNQTLQYNAKVGAGGVPDMTTNTTVNSNGKDTTAFGLTALGGGSGGLSKYDDSLLIGRAGGSGGGGAGTWNTSSSVIGGRATDPTQGNVGETGYIDANTYSRIGGGGGGAGGSGGLTGKGFGGLGIADNIMGEIKYYAGGGGAGSNYTSGNTVGGSNIGGNGGNYNSISPTNPVQNTGSGGAGCGEQLRFPTSGADGIIIIRVNKTTTGVTVNDHVKLGINSDGNFGNIGKASILNKWSLVGNVTYAEDVDTLTFNGYSTYLYNTNYIDLNKNFEFSTIIKISSSLPSNIQHCNIMMNCINQWDSGRATLNLHWRTDNKIWLNTAMGNMQITSSSTVPKDTEAKITLKRLDNIFYLYINDVLNGQVNAWNVENRGTNVFGAWLMDNNTQQFFGTMKNITFNYL